MGPVEFGMGRDGRVEVSLGQLWQGLQTAVRRVRPPYCSLGNRSGMAMRVLELLHGARLVGLWPGYWVCG
jgi:hypothetical protein